MSTSLTFAEYNEARPCDTCSAPCCRTLLVPQKTPATWMDLDFVRYQLNFENVEIVVSKEGDWRILVRANCVHLDAEAHTCRAHNSSEQPKTCAYFNPYQCYYRTNLLGTDSAQVYILDRDSFQHWVQLVSFDENGHIIDAPSFEASSQALSEWRQQQEAHEPAPEETGLPACGPPERGPAAS